MLANFAKVDFFSLKTTLFTVYASIAVISQKSSSCFPSQVLETSYYFSLHKKAAHNIMIYSAICNHYNTYSVDEAKERCTLVLQPSHKKPTIQLK